MQIAYKPSFKKQFKKLDAKTKLKFKQRLQLFIAQPEHPTLRLHPLRGTLSGMWSINISGDLRAIFRRQDGELVVFYMIGTHSQLY